MVTDTTTDYNEYQRQYRLRKQPKITNRIATKMRYATKKQLVEVEFLLDRLLGTPLELRPKVKEAKRPVLNIPSKAKISAANKPKPKRCR